MITHANTYEEFKESIKEGKVLVDFFATWCGPCKMVAPVLEELGKDPSFDANIVKVDVDEVEEAAAEFGIQAIPTLILFKDGKPVDKVLGFQRKDQIINFVNK